MSMSKQDFVALADAIREHGTMLDHHSLVRVTDTPLTKDQINMLADFCRRQNPNFNRERWLDYIAGKCGPNGGAIKHSKG